MGNIKEALLPYLQWQARLCKVGYEMVSELSPGNSSKGDNCQDEPSEGSEIRKRTVTFQDSSKEENTDIPKRKPGDRRHSIYVKRSLKLTQAEVESEMKKVIKYVICLMSVINKILETLLWLIGISLFYMRSKALKFLKCQGH